MTPVAVRQFIAIFGGQQVAKGSSFAEPVRERLAETYKMGQSDYIVVSLQYGDNRAGRQLPSPFQCDTDCARLWAAGKLNERKIEQMVVEAYAHAARIGREI